MNLVNLVIGYLKDPDTIERLVRENYPKDYEVLIKSIRAASDRIAEEIKAAKDKGDKSEDIEEEEEEATDETVLDNGYFGIIVLGEDVISDYIEKIIIVVRNVYSGTGMTDEQITNIVLRYLGIKSLSDSIYMLSVNGEMRAVVEKATKAVSGLDLKSFKSGLGKAFSKGAKIKIFGKTYVWDPAEHPRDELGRFAFKPESDKKDDKNENTSDRTENTGKTVDVIKKAQKKIRSIRLFF